jgi:ABC-type amino acid transport system permease subunit
MEIFSKEVEMFIILFLNFIFFTFLVSWLVNFIEKKKQK